MEGQQHASGTVEKILLVVLGAVIGVVPVIVSNNLQANAAARQRIIDRRLDTIKDYSAACHRDVLAGRRSIQFIDVLSDPSTLTEAATAAGSAANIVSFLLKQAEDVQREIAESTLALRTEVDIANSLFGTHLPTPAEFPVPVPSAAALAAAKKDVEEFRQRLPKLAEDCAANAKLLMSNLNK